MDRLQSRLWYGVEADTGSYAASMIEADSECEIWADEGEGHSWASFLNGRSKK